MRYVHRIADVSVSTTSTKPLCGRVEIDTADSSIQLELTEEMAHSLCTDLERFLTQGQPAKPNKVRLSRQSRRQPGRSPC